MHDMCTSLSVIIINIQRHHHQQCETVKPPIKNQKLKNWIHTLKIIPVLQ